jgi:hypothetical protein
MAIYTVPYRKRLKDKNHDLKTLLKTMRVNEDELRPGADLEKMLARAKERGLDLYVWVCPYSIEIGPGPYLHADWDFTKAEDAFHSAADDI